MIPHHEQESYRKRRGIGISIYRLYIYIISQEITSLILGFLSLPYFFLFSLGIQEVESA